MRATLPRFPVLPFFPFHDRRANLLPTPPHFTLFFSNADLTVANRQA